MATSSVKAIFKEGTFTPNTSSTKVSGVSGSVCQSGNIATLSVKLTMTAMETSNWITIGNVSILPKAEYTTQQEMPNAADISAGLIRFQLVNTGVLRVFYGGNAEYNLNLSYEVA